MRRQLLLYASAMGSVDLVNILVDELGLSVDSLAFPLVCFDCEPMRLTSQCEDEGHGIGRETPLIAACMAGRAHVVEALCRRGANPNVQNEVCTAAVLLPFVPSVCVDVEGVCAPASPWLSGAVCLCGHAAGGTYSAAVCNRVLLCGLCTAAGGAWCGCDFGE